ARPVRDLAAVDPGRRARRTRCDDGAAARRTARRARAVPGRRGAGPRRGVGGDHRSAPTDGMVLSTRDDARVIVRPSGTEPKLKCYIEVHEEVPAAADDARLGEVRRRAAAQLERIGADMRRALTGT